MHDAIEIRVTLVDEELKGCRSGGRGVDDLQILHYMLVEMGGILLGG